MTGESGGKRKSFDRNYFPQKADVLNVVLDHITQGMVVVGQDYRTLAFNQHFEDMFQLPPGAIEVGADFREILKAWAAVTGQNQEMLDRAIYQLDKSFTFEFEFSQQIKGELRWCRMTHNPLPQKGFIRTFTDITERKSAEELLQVRMTLLEFSGEHTLEELLRKTLDEVGRLVQSPIGFYHFIEPDQKTLSLQTWSTTTLEGFSKAEGKGLHYPIGQAGVWVDCVHQRKPVIHNDYASLAHRNGLPQGHASVTRELVVPIFRADRIVAILGVGNKPQDYTEQDVKVVEYLADVAWEIAERKRAEQALQENEQFLRETQLVAGLGTYVLDITSGTWTSSAILDKIFGIDDSFDKSVEGWTSLIHPDDRQMMRDYFTHYVIGTHHRFDKEYRIVRHDDKTEQWVHGLGKLQLNAKNNPIRMIGTIQNITERKKVEIELKDAQANVKVLCGMLPICASCKKIRDDKGYWQQIENYIHEHSEAEFSHSICPDCAKALYPTYYHKIYRLGTQK